MFNEIIFSKTAPLEGQAYVGPKVWLPSDIKWPTTQEGKPLSHLMAIPTSWFSKKTSLKNHCISIFIPYTKNSSTHYRDLSTRNTNQSAVVIGYFKSPTPIDQAHQISDSGSAFISANLNTDNEENLASKVDGIDAWLQREIIIDSHCRRASIYGADLDICLPHHKGILSDGMGYLFLHDDFESRKITEVGKFFLQL